MTDFVLEQSNNENLQKHLSNKNGHEFMNYWHSVFSYAKFLKEPLKLGMFVPCDENDMPLEIPFNYGAYLVSLPKEDFNYNEIDCLQYQQAKDRVLFDGFELVEIQKYGFDLIMKAEDWSESLSVLFEETIEDLLTYSFNPEFELTQSAIKKYSL